MNLLVCDYDGTLKPYLTGRLGLKINMKYIEQFRKKGNIFVISTARTFVSMEKDITKYQIPHDFISCNSGTTLIDNKGELIYQSSIKKDTLIGLRDDLKSLKYIKDVLYHGPLCSVNENNLDQESVVQIVIKSDFLSTRRELFDLLSKKYPSLEQVSIPGFTYIENKGGKSKSILELEAKREFDYILALGDSRNDLHLLKEYKGFRIFFSDPVIWNEGIPVSSLKQIVKRLG